MTADTNIVAQCPACRAKFRVAAQHVGRRTKCPSCQAPFEVQPVGEPPPSGRNDSSPPESTQIGVNCLLCGTRMYGTAAQVGKPLTCPDCGTETTLPALKPPRKPVLPEAMRGDQYELWEGEDQPWGSTLAAMEPATIAVHCELCDTLQYVTPDLVGSKVKCPDCGHETRVREPAGGLKQATQEPEELEVEPPRVSEQFAIPSAPPVYSRLLDFESKSEEEKQREISRVATDRKARPQMPRWPLLSGWMAFLFDPSVVSRWISLTALLAIFTSVVLFGLAVMFSPMGAIAGMCLLCGGATFIALCLASAAACAVTIVTESSEGNNRVMQWPGINPIDWMGESGYLLVGASAAAAPGYIVARVFSAEGSVIAIAMGVSAWLLFPIMHLSTLEASSPFSLVMPGVLGSLGRWPGNWLLFYLLSAIDFVITGIAVLLLMNQGVPGLLIAIAPALAALVLYFRLLGRLAWRIRDGSPA